MAQQNQSVNPATTKPSVADQWKSFDQTKRARLLTKMSPEQKKKLRSMLETPGNETPWQKFERTRSQLPHGSVATWRNPQEAMAQTATNLGEESQAQFSKSTPDVWKDGRYAGSRPLLERVSHFLLGETAGAGQVVAKLGAGAMDWKTAATLLVSKLSPAAAAAFFATQGAKGAYDAIQSGKATPDNVQNFLLGLSAVTGAAGAGMEGGAGHPVEAVKNAVRSVPDTIRLVGQESAGAGRGEVFRKVRDRAMEVRGREAEVEKVNNERAAEYAEAKKRVEEFNREQEAATGRKAELGKEVDKDSAQLSDDLKSLRKTVKDKEAKLYAPVDAATEGATIPADEALALVEHAENDILQGSQESIKQFREIINRAEKDPDLLEDEDDPRGHSYSPFGERGVPIPLRDARGFVTEIGDAVANRPGLLGDVRRALTYVGKGLKSQVMDVYEKAGVADQARAADAWHGQMARTFDAMRAIKTGRGSPVAFAIRAPKDAPAYVRDPFLNPKYGEMARKAIRAYESDPEVGAQAKTVGKRVDKIVKDEAERKAIKPEKPKESPEPPKEKVAKVPPPMNAFRVRFNRLEDFADRPYTFWDFVLPARILEKVILKFPVVKEWVGSLPRSSDPDFIPKGERVESTPLGQKTKAAAKFVGDLGDKGMAVTKDYMRGSITRDGFKQRLEVLFHEVDPADIDAIVTNVDRIKAAGAKIIGKNKGVSSALVGAGAAAGASQRDEGR